MSQKETSKQAQEDINYVNQIKKGDKKAFEFLLNRYYNSIYYMILKLVKNMADAEELASETFTKAYNNLDNYSPKYAFSTWLFRIGSNLSIDFLRKRKVGFVSLEEEENTWELGLNSKTPDPEENLIIKQKIDNLKDVVSKLQGKYKQLIELRYFEEYSYEEIAEELNIPMGTVKTQLFRAKAQLLNRMTKK